MEAKPPHLYPERRRLVLVLPLGEVDVLKVRVGYELADVRLHGGQQLLVRLVRAPQANLDVVKGSVLITVSLSITVLLTISFLTYQQFS